MKKYQSKKETYWILAIKRDKETLFIYATGGGWGPAHLPTSDFTKAVIFSSKEDALYSEAKRGWTEAFPIQIEIKTSMKII